MNINLKDLEIMEMAITGYELELCGIIRKLDMNIDNLKSEIRLLESNIGFNYDIDDEGEYL